MKALTIPENTENQPAPLPWYRSVRAVAAAASVVLVATVGISLYFVFGNKSPIPVAPKPNVSATEIAPNPPTDTNGEPVTGGATEAQVDPKTGASDAYRATEGSTQPSASPSPTGSPAPSRPDETQSIAPTIPASTQGATDQPSSPTFAPTIAPQTDPLWELDPTEPPWEYSPTEAAIEPIQPETVSDPVFRLSVRLPAKYKGSFERIYCRIYDRTAKTVLGDPDRFAASHQADVIVDDNGVTFIYVPSEHGIEMTPGSYAVAFHNEDGVNLFTNYVEVK